MAGHCEMTSNLPLCSNSGRKEVVNWCLYVSVCWMPQSLKQWTRQQNRFRSHIIAERLCLHVFVSFREQKKSELLKKVGKHTQLMSYHEEDEFTI
jgi:hypothetical protein